MQRREFISAVGVVAASAVSQSNPSTRNQSVPLRFAPSSQMGFISISPNRAMDRESDSGWSASYAMLHSALRVQTTPTVKLFAARRWSRCPPMFDAGRHSIIR
jgi:hypothetical protein